MTCIPPARAQFNLTLRFTLKAFLFLCLWLFPAICVQAQATRLVIIKLDGVPYDTVNQYVQQRDPRTGKSQLPWIDYIFYQRGTRLENFYVRGLSLSGPSWSLLDTGQHLQIKGNVEFDRYTLHAYDYLNLIPFFVNGAAGKQADMPGVEVLDSLGVPLLMDAYAHDEQYNGFGIYERGPRYLTFSNALQNRFKKGPKELFDEWTMGLETRNMVNDELVRELLTKLKNPQIHYLSILMQDFDHTAHHTADPGSQLQILKDLDAMIGQVWTTIQSTPETGSTALVVVSDHGMNSDANVYSQGFNLVKLLNSSAGGGHHVGTKRRLLLDYSIRGLNPFYDFVTTTSRDSYYLKGLNEDYPTAMLDFDGNERASVHLRDSDLNTLHILLQQLQRKDLPEKLRRPLMDAFFATLERRRNEWQDICTELTEEIEALRRAITKQTAVWEQQPKKLTEEEKLKGRDDEIKRIYAQLNHWKSQEREYSAYEDCILNLLKLQRESFEPPKLRITDLIPARAMGDQNSVYQLQNYVVGVSPEGLTLNDAGVLDMERSFKHINYFSLLQGMTVRNNVQAQISNRPIDFVAKTIPTERIKTFFPDLDPEVQTVWVYGGDDKQALVFARDDDNGNISLRYQPIRNLQQNREGKFSFEAIEWEPGLPLRIIEDANLGLPAEGRPQWLSQWHSDLEWLRALHRTHYSNGIVGLFEALGIHSISRPQPASSTDESLLRRFVQRQRKMIEADLLVVANNHWNFDVRGFNPGGNHGSFFRISTHSTWLLAGGPATGIPHGLAIEEPYDSLSFMPTMLAITGKLRDDNSLAPDLMQRGFGHFPGPVVKEVVVHK